MVTTPLILSAIVHHLSRRPARLTGIIDQLYAWEEVEEFRDLIRTYLPGLEDEISREPSIDRQVIRFGHGSERNTSRSTTSRNSSIPERASAPSSSTVYQSSPSGWTWTNSTSSGTTRAGDAPS